MTVDLVESIGARSKEEADPPSLLARAFEPFTRALFSQAGLAPGMRVLDVHSGAGDVAFLAREFVGSEGHVTGFDRAPGVIDYANERAAFRGLSNVAFFESDMSTLPFGQNFDAVVGRTVLMYRHDPAADLQRLVQLLRPGGLVVFQEFDMLPGKTVPPTKVVDDVRAWLLDVFARSEIELEMGPKLYATFRAAGLDAPEMRVDGFIGGHQSISPTLVVDVARLLLPQAEALGAITAEEAQIDTLEERMRADLERTGGVMSTPLLIGAWARLPS